MTGDLTNLATKLRDMAQAPAPPMNIDIGRARWLGRRRRNRRRIALGGGLAAVALTAALVTPLIVSPVGTPEPDVAANPAPEANPMIAYASFGWLPESITRIEYGKGAHGDYAHAVNENTDLGTHFWLTVHPAGDLPKLPAFAGRGEQRTAAAQPVNGRTAYWVTENTSDPLNNGDAFLLWQTPDGQWAELHAYYLDFDDPQDVIRRVAAEVAVAERALPLPLRITGLPGDFRVSEATFYRPMPRHMGTGAWLLQLFYTVGTPAMTIEVSPEGTARSAEGAPCKTAKGVDVCVVLSDTVPGAVNALGGPQAILDRITPLGIDERDWTTRPTG